MELCNKLRRKKQNPAFFVRVCSQGKVSMCASSGHIHVLRVQSLLFPFGLRPFGLKSVGNVSGAVLALDVDERTANAWEENFVGTSNLSKLKNS